MRTKKVEIASVPIVASVEEPIPTITDEIPVPVTGAFDVVFRFQKRENAESFIAKVKSLGYDNSELREV